MKKKIFCIILIGMLFIGVYNINAEEITEQFDYDSEVYDNLETSETLTTYVNTDNRYFNVKDNMNFEAGDIKHNLFSLGNYINTFGNIEGIHFALGNKLNISSNDDYGVYLGNNVNIKSNIFYDLFVAGNNINLTNDATVNRDVYIAGNQVYIDTDINGNVFVVANSLYLNNITVNGDMYFAGSKIKFGDNVTITGMLKYNESANVDGLENTSVNSAKTYVISEDNELVEETSFSTKLLGKLRSGISLCIVLIVLFSIFPKLYDKLPKKITEKLTKDALIGLTTLICVPFVVILLLITLIGIPLGIILLLLYCICIYVSFGITSILIGKLIYNMLLKKQTNMYLEVIIGVFIIKLITLIPVVSFIVNILCLIIGLGIIVGLVKRKKN